MKKILVLGILFLLQVKLLHAQYSISTAIHLESIPGGNFHSHTILPPIGTQVEPGPDYSCTSFQSKPVWFYFTVCDYPVNYNYFNLEISNSFTPYDTISAMLWGPLFDTTNLVSQLNTSNLYGCATSNNQFPPFTIQFYISNIPKKSYYIGVAFSADSSSFLDIGQAGPNFTNNNSCGICHSRVTSLRENICIVALDSATQKNMPVWEKDSFNTGVEGYNIYREGAVLNQFDSIGNVSAQLPSLFIDQAVNPSQKSYSYRISGRDSCGNTFLDNYTWSIHTTIHLQSNAGILGEVNLSWNAYLGYTPLTYYISRGSSPSTINLLDSVASNITSYTDFNPVPGLNFYRISFIKPDGCYADSTTVFYENKSNLTYSNVLGIVESALAKQVLVFPNPTDKLINIDYSLLNSPVLKIELKDLKGNRLTDIPLHSFKRNLIQVSDLCAGVYILELTLTNGVIQKKILVR